MVSVSTPGAITCHTALPCSTLVDVKVCWHALMDGIHPPGSKWIGFT